MEEIFEKIGQMLRAFYPVLYLTSFEYERTKQKIQGIVNSISPQANIYGWDCVNGLCLYSENGQKEIENKEEPEEILKYILSITDVSKKDIFILEDFHNYIEETKVKHYVRKIAEKAKYTNTHVIIVSATYKLPTELEKYVTVLSVPLPNRADIDRTLLQVEKDSKVPLGVDLRNKLVDAALGMTSMEADLAFCLAVVKDNLGPNAPLTVSSEKEQIIKKSGMLEYVQQNETLKDIGAWMF